VREGSPVGAHWRVFPSITFFLIHNHNIFIISYNFFALTKDTAAGEQTNCCFLYPSIYLFIYYVNNDRGTILLRIDSVPKPKEEKEEEEEEQEEQEQEEEEEIVLKVQNKEKGKM